MTFCPTFLKLWLVKTWTKYACRSRSITRHNFITNVGTGWRSWVTRIGWDELTCTDVIELKQANWIALQLYDTLCKGLFLQNLLVLKGLSWKMDFIANGGGCMCTYPPPYPSSLGGVHNWMGFPVLSLNYQMSHLEHQIWSQKYPFPIGKYWLWF